MPVVQFKEIARGRRRQGAHDRLVAQALPADRAFTTLTEESQERREASAERRLLRLRAVPTERRGWPATWPFNCQLLGVGLLHADMTYQRDLDPIHLQNIHNNFDPDRVGTIAVNLRPDGTYWIVDGQHRVQVLKWREVAGVWCKVYQVPPEQEPKLIRKLNRGQKRFGVRDAFRADLASGNEKIWDLYRVVERCGFSVDPDRRHDPTHIEALDALLRLHNARAPERDSTKEDDTPEAPSADKVERVLRLIKRVWGTEQHEARTHYMLLGLDLFLDLYSADLDEDAFHQALHALPIDHLYDAIIRRRAELADAGRTLGMVTTVVQMIIERYSGHLDEERLHDAYRKFSTQHGRHVHLLRRP